MKHKQSVSRIFLALFMALFMVFGVSTSSASAQETTDSARMAELIQRIQELQAQVKTLQEQYAGLRTEIQEAMQLTRTLASGMSGEDVRALQELLATDAELYPEGLVTGFYGPMTERAIERLQARFGIEQVGTVGPITQRTLNELFKEYRKERGNMFKAVSVEKDDDDDGDDDDDDIDYSEYQPGVKNVLICHTPRGNESKGHTIAVGGPAVQAHLDHGDTVGRCDDDDDEEDDEDEDDDEEDDEDDDEEDEDEDDEEDDDEEDEDEDN